MDAYEVTIRKGVFNAINSAKSGYELPDSVIQETYFPREDLENLGTIPHIKIVAIGHSRERERLLRTPTKVLLSLPVQIAVQQRVDNLDDVDYLDSLLRFAEQIRETCEDDELVSGEDYNWERTEPLHDEEGNTYSYQDLIQKGVFQVIFTVFYQYIKQPTQSC